MGRREAKTWSFQIRRAARMGLVPIETILPKLNPLQSEVLTHCMSYSVGRFLYVRKNSRSLVDAFINDIDQGVCQYGLAREFSTLLNSLDPLNVASRAKLYGVLHFMKYHVKADERENLIRAHLTALSEFSLPHISEAINIYDNALEKTRWYNSGRIVGENNPFIRQLSYFLNAMTPFTFDESGPALPKVSEKASDAEIAAPKFGGLLEGRAFPQPVLPFRGEIVPSLGFKREAARLFIIWGPLWGNCERAIRDVKKTSPVDKGRLEALKKFQYFLMMVQDLNAAILKDDVTDRHAHRFPSFMNALFNTLKREAEGLGIWPKP